MSLLLRALSRVTSPQLLWPTAAREVGLIGTRAVGCRPTALGWALTLRLRPPATPAVLDAYAEPLATAFGVALLCCGAGVHLACIHRWVQS